MMAVETGARKLEEDFFGGGMIELSLSGRSKLCPPPIQQGRVEQPQLSIESEVHIRV